jgi:DNA replication and repair protein RecF
LYIKHIHLKNFRCFSEFTLDLDQPLVLLEGPNGSGKTSLLEALHYVCYLRSFRTHIPRDLIKLGDESFFIKIALADAHGVDHEIQVGSSGKKRLVKLDQKPIQSYKELLDYYRIVTLTEDDLNMVKGGPDVRRSFLDQALLLFNSEVLPRLRTLRACVEQRNALLINGTSRSSYDIWTQQLWENSRQIQQDRVILLQQLESRTNKLLEENFQESITIQLVYEPKKIERDKDFKSFLIENPSLYDEEMRMKRSLFGAHLDDFAINFCEKKSKVYASRGQQKLIAILLKLAVMQEVMEQKGKTVFLLDDFMTDFDDNVVSILLNLLMRLECQLIFTCPNKGSSLEKKLKEHGAQTTLLTYRNMS